MNRMFYKLILTMVIFAGLMIGIVKGQEARQKWVTKKKNRYETRYLNLNQKVENSQVVLDEFEMEAYHQ